MQHGQSSSFKPRLYLLSIIAFVSYFWPEIRLLNQRCSLQLIFYSSRVRSTITFEVSLSQTVRNAGKINGYCEITTV